MAIADVSQFYGFSSQLSATSSISSFKIIVSSVNGQVETFDNNGSGYLVQDSVMLLPAQSCLTKNAKNLTVVAAVSRLLISYF
jgi:hypothetical protein